MWLSRSIRRRRFSAEKINGVLNRKPSFIAKEADNNIENVSQFTRPTHRQVSKDLKGEHLMSKYENEFKEEFTVWGRKLELDVIFHLYDDEEISEHQIRTYEDLKANHIQYFDSVKDEIYEYVEEDTGDHELPENIFKFVMPKAIIIQREYNKFDNEPMEFALLCDYKYNIEDGISVSFENGISTGVGPEDVVL